jgi:hypothetical protein
VGGSGWRGWLVGWFQTHPAHPRAVIPSESVEHARPSEERTSVVVNLLELGARGVIPNPVRKLVSNEWKHVPARS